MDYSSEKNKAYEVDSPRKYLSGLWKPWRKSLSVQRQTLVALFYRETKTRFGGQSLGMLWAFGEALTHVIFFWILWASMGRHTYNGMPIPVFLVSGLLPFFFFKNCFNKTSNCISGNQSLLVFSQIHILDFAIARYLVEVTIYASAMTIFIIILYFFKFNIEIYSIVNIISGFLLMGLAGLSMGLVYLPFAGKYKVIDTFVPFIFTFLYFLSGVIFPLEQLPAQAYEYLAYNPIFHLVNYIRSGFNIDFYVKEGMRYTISVIVFILMIGLILQKKLKKLILDD